MSRSKVKLTVSNLVMALLLAPNNPAAAQNCDPQKSIHVMAVGDILMHGPLQRFAWSQADGFQAIWRDLVPLLKRADIAYGNLEGPIAPGRAASGRSLPDIQGFNGVIYTGYPRFNYPARLALDLARSGFDLVSTSNNHTLNRGWQGADSTLSVVQQAGLVPFGTWPAGTEGVPYVTFMSKGLKTIWLACTFSTNGIPDRLNQTADCFRDRTALVNLVRALALDPSNDAVIVTPHWGSEYQLNPSPQQVRLGRDFIEAGAAAVIGTHPHVLQPWEEVVRKDGSRGWVVYSTGNFASNQLTFPRNVSAAIHLILSRTRISHHLQVTGIGYTPLTMNRLRTGYQVTRWDRAGSVGPGSAEALWRRQFGEGRRLLEGEDPFSALCQK